MKTIITWLYFRYAREKVNYRIQYSDPFDVWMQIKTGDKEYTLISNNQN
jgi:hypothetical protein